MAIAIYEEVGSGRRHWADSTSPTTKALLAGGGWVLFDDTPGTPPPASSSDALGAEMAERVPGSGPFAVALRAAFVAVVEHGANANAARPAGAASVLWIGSVEPVNMAEGVDELRAVSA